MGNSNDKPSLRNFSASDWVSNFLKTAPANPETWRWHSGLKINFFCLFATEIINSRGLTLAEYVPSSWHHDDDQADYLTELWWDKMTN